MVTTKLLNDAGIRAQQIIELQAALGQEDESDDDDDELRRPGVNALHPEVKSILLCNKIIDPLRKALSGATDFYFPNDGQLVRLPMLISIYLRAANYFTPKNAG